MQVRGTANVRKQELLLAAAQNLGLLLRAKYGVGTPRRMADRGRQAQQTATGLLGTLLVLLSSLWAKLSVPWDAPQTAHLACHLALTNRAARAASEFFNAQLSHAPT